MLKQLIDSLNLKYVNPDITEENFPIQPIRGEDFKIFKFNRYISSENAIKEMDKEGYKAVNVYELLTWAKAWNGKDWVVALGQKPSDGGVPYLSGWHGRRFYLHRFGRGWHGHYQFLGVRESKLGNSKPQLKI